MVYRRWQDLPGEAQAALREQAALTLTRLEGL
jgi:deoxyribodipyrimidine photolyase-related protein